MGNFIFKSTPWTLSQTTDGDVVDWESDCGWFDELLPIYWRWVADLKLVWTEDQEADNSDKAGLLDSYFKYNLSEQWNIQQEQKQSLTLGLEDHKHLDECLPAILAIE